MSDSETSSGETSGRQNVRLRNVRRRNVRRRKVRVPVQPLNDSSTCLRKKWYEEERVHFPVLTTGGEQEGLVYSDPWMRMGPPGDGGFFAPALVNCPLPNSPKDKRPIKVTLNLEGDNSTTSELHIQYPQPRRWKFLICFSPLHREFNDANLVVHNLELAQILGAEHAVVYNTSIGADVDKVLRYYVSTGFLEVKGWRDPPEPVHYKAQMGAINDCLLYGRNSSDFIVFMDFDEMIVPKYHKNWSEFIRDVQLNYNSSALASSQKGSLTHMNDALVTALRTPRKVNATTQRSMRRRKRSMRRRKRSMQRLGRHLQDTALHVLGQPWGLCLRQQRVPLGQCDKFNCPRLEVSQSASHHFSPEAKANCADMARPLQEHRGSPGGENHGHP
ncbi:hypothetical protein C0Q70_11522 [Pomacea canaliculata]|uniref:Glycosyltransferase family 92 protein n=1 Tax=Pomacea canaliculata TaxID=400727 RepID=A0A2T7P678_POMCA|nr:hypothetical protein C0Q70_11522 [Pomacea canaliculata]